MHRERIIVKCIIRKWYVREYAELIWLSAGSYKQLHLVSGRQEDICSYYLGYIRCQYCLAGQKHVQKELTYQINLVPYLFQPAKLLNTPARRIEVWIFVSQLS
jgi:hypothetical protein